MSNSSSRTVSFLNYSHNAKINVTKSRLAFERIYGTYTTLAVDKQ